VFNQGISVWAGSVFVEADFGPAQDVPAYGRVCTQWLRPRKQFALAKQARCCMTITMFAVPALLIHVARAHPCFHMYVYVCLGAQACACDYALLVRAHVCACVLWECVCVHVCACEIVCLLSVCVCVCVCTCKSWSARSLWS
jgi:hypothetical protein